MKVLVSVVHSTYQRDMLDGLKDKHEFILFGGAKSRQVFKEFEYHPIEFLESMSPLAEASIGRLLLRKRRDVDLYHFATPREALPHYLLNKITKLPPFAYTLHWPPYVTTGMSEEYFIKGAYRKKHRAIVKLIEAAAERVFVCDFWRKKVAEDFGLSGVTIDHGIDSQKFSKVADAKKKLGVEGKIVVSTMANDFDRAPLGSGFFFELSRKLKKEFVEKIIVNIYGRSPNLVVPKDLSWVNLQSLPRDEIPLRLSATDVIVFTSLFNNMPLSILESMACETPAAAFGVGGIPEAVEDGVNGAVVRGFDIDELYKKVADILADEKKRAAYGRKARERVKEKYNLRQFWDKHDKLYERVAGASF